jgi:hypothetical protein
MTGCAPCHAKASFLNSGRYRFKVSSRSAFAVATRAAEGRTSSWLSSAVCRQVPINVRSKGRNVRLSNRFWSHGVPFRVASLGGRKCLVWELHLAQHGARVAHLI